MYLRHCPVLHTGVGGAGVCMCECMNVCVCVCVCVCVYVCIYIYIYMCVCIHTYICACVCVYIYIYIQTYVSKSIISNLRVVSHQVVKRFLAANANINAACEDESTSLYIACQNGHTDVVRVLIQAGALLDARVSRGLIYIYIGITHYRVRLGLPGPSA